MFDLQLNEIVSKPMYLNDDDMETPVFGFVHDINRLLHWISCFVINYFIILLLEASLPNHGLPVTWAKQCGLAPRLIIIY